MKTTRHRHGEERGVQLRQGPGLTAVTLLFVCLCCGVVGAQVDTAGSVRTGAAPVRHVMHVEGMLGLITPLDHNSFLPPTWGVGVFYRDTTLTRWTFGLSYTGYDCYMLKGDTGFISTGDGVGGPSAALLTTVIRFRPAVMLRVFVQAGGAFLAWDSTSAGRRSGSAVIPVMQAGVGVQFSTAESVEIGVVQGLSSIMLSTGERARLFIGTVRVTLGITNE